MTDQELLEKAARAVGYEVEENRLGRLFLPHERDRAFLGKEWNPLKDNGDAFALLHAVQADIHHGEDDLGKGIITIQPPELSLSESPWCETGDIEALRRTIVQAAALVHDKREGST